MSNDLKTLKKQLLQLRELHEAGALPREQYDAARAPLEQRLLELVMSPAAAAPRASRPLWLLIGAAVVLVAGAGYWWTGSPALLAGGEAARGNPHTTGEVAPHATDAEQMAGMVERLAERLKKEPKDAEGWAMLARSYTVLERNAEAVKAYEKAVALAPKDADLLADYADALAMKNGRQLAGEAMKMVERALKADPRHLKALALAGTHAFDRKDYKAAVKYWQQAVDAGAPDHELVRQLEPGLAQARELAGLPAAAAQDKRAPAPGTALNASVSGTVTLAPALARQASPDDTVFIYARDAQGSRMPLAILRKQVRDLPLRFTLDDSLAMSPAAKLSGAKQVIVEARISKSGEARAQAGDLSGQVGPVGPGAAALALEIRTTVQP
jgi:cytochrome c-type biogenesis protein CcmH